MTNPHRQLQELIQTGDLLAGRYRIGRRVGAGAYGMIFFAVDEQTRREVAVKAIPHEARQRSETAIGRFQREMKVIGSLKHQNIISLYDWGQSEVGMIYMVLEYVDGETLDRVVRNNPMGLNTALDTTRQLVDALGAAHAKGIIHRDLKPANVMLVPSERRGYLVKVLDFGMAKVLEPLDDESLVDLTREGMAVGTPRYIAPEQARGLEVGPWTDFYAVGLLMYEMITGFQAVEASTVEAAVAAHVSRKPLELSAIDMVPPLVRPVLFKLMEKDPGRRYRSAEEVLRALDSLSPPRSAEYVDSSRGEIGPALGEVTGDFPGAGGYGYSQGKSTVEPQLSKAGQGEIELTPESNQDLDLELDYEGYRGGERQIELDAERSAEPDLDYERYQKFAPAKNDPIARRRSAWRDRWFRPPRRVGEWIEGSVSVALVPLAVITVGAQASELEYGLRLAVSVAPLVLALLLAASRRGGEWERSFGRIGWICCSLAIAAALVMGPDEVATELLRSPAWILRPVEGLPGMALAESLVTWLSQNWAALLRAVLPI